MPDEILTPVDGLSIVRSSYRGITDFTVMKQQKLTDTLTHIVPIFGCDTFEMAMNFIDNYEEDNDFED